MVSWLMDLMGRGTATDPVCGMQVSKRSAAGGTLEHDGTTYYFCAPGCRAEFAEDPEGYLSGRKKMDM
jgi:YHS domain-containing protein